MDITQPAVSMQIKQIEEELGHVLFDKKAKPMVLTEAGRLLLRHARAILAQVHTAEDAFSSLEKSLQGQLHLGVVSTANYFAPVLMTEFRHLYPEVRLKLTVEKRDTLLAMLAEGQIDIAITGFPPSDVDVEAETFSRNPHCVVARSDHPLAGKHSIRWEDLGNEPFLFREQGSSTRKFLEHILQSRSMRVNVMVELQGNETMKHAVMSGMGLTFMSAHAFQVELEAGRLAVLDVEGMPKQLDWCLLQRRNSSLTALAAAFRAFVLENGERLTVCRTTSIA